MKKSFRVDFSQSDIVKARAKAFALLLQWAEEAEKAKVAQNTRTTKEANNA